MPAGPKNWPLKPTLRRRQASEHATVAEDEAERARRTRATQAEQQMSREGQSAGRHDEQAALERNAQQTGHDVREGCVLDGDAAADFLLAKSRTRSRLADKILDVFMEIYAITVIAALTARSAASFTSGAEKSTTSADASAA